MSSEVANNVESKNINRDLLLPTALFAAIGGMVWAVRGCSGFGATAGCMFAGVMWGAAWWFIAREPGAEQSRRYSSGWIILALTIGFGFSGGRGWMQWPSFFEGHLLTNAGKGEFVPISRAYGFLWLFIAGVPWAGLGACLLAWCGTERPASLEKLLVRWALRIACGAGAVFIARYLFARHPEIFLPLYSSVKEKYLDLQTNPNLRRLIGDNRLAIAHLALYLGFLLAEVIWLDWKNVKLITTVGVINGAGWALCQNWKWAYNVFPSIHFNWWRCWESSGGISIGIAYGIAFYLVNRPVPEDEKESQGLNPPNRHPNLERLGACLGLIYGLGSSIRSGLKGWANIYLGHEEYWSAVLWRVIWPLMLFSIVVTVIWIVVRRLQKGYPGDVFPYAFVMIWVVLITQNLLAQLVTGPLSDPNELAFNIYYLILFGVSASIVVYFRRESRLDSSHDS